MKHINRFFSIILLFSCILGLFVPSAGDLTNDLLILSLSIVIFSSFFQINLSFRSLREDFRLSLVFLATRFVILPVIVFIVLKNFNETWATIMLLILLLPAAVSSPAFSTIFGGKPDLSLKILLYSSFFSVIGIPVLSRLFLGSSSGLNASGLLVTLVYTILLPFLLHLPVRKIRPVREFMLRTNSLITLISLSVMSVLVTAQNKEIILGHPARIGGYAIISVIMYLLIYLAGYYFIRGNDINLRRTFSISSGANNIGLGVALTAIYFRGDVNVFFIVSQIIWTVILVPVRPWLLSRDKTTIKGRRSSSFD